MLVSDFYLKTNSFAEIFVFHRISVSATARPEWWSKFRLHIVFIGLADFQSIKFRPSVFNYARILEILTIEC